MSRLKVGLSYDKPNEVIQDFNKNITKIGSGTGSRSIIATETRTRAVVPDMMKLYQVVSSLIALPYKV